MKAIELNFFTISRLETNPKIKYWPYLDHDVQSIGDLNFMATAIMKNCFIVKPTVMYNLFVSIKFWHRQLNC